MLATSFAHMEANCSDQLCILIDPFLLLVHDVSPLLCSICLFFLWYIDLVWLPDQDSFFGQRF